MIRFPQRLLDFWFGELDSRGWAPPDRKQRWFTGGPDFDEALRQQFGQDVETALATPPPPATDPVATLQEILLRDQLPRNLFRGQPRAFAGDPAALALTHQLLANRTDLSLPLDARIFTWMPLEHAESETTQDTLVALFDEALSTAAPPDQKTLSNYRQHALDHRDIIRRFGRFPHRNATLNRPSTDAETQYLTTANHYGQ